MSLTRSMRRPAAAAVLGAALLSAGFTGAASAATISDQAVLGPGTHIPTEFAGYAEPKNDKVPSGYVIVSRTVQMAEGEIHLDGSPITARLTAPTGYKLVAVGSNGRINWAAAPARYAGKRAVTLRLTAGSEDPGKASATGAFYALAKRASKNAPEPKTTRPVQSTLPVKSAVSPQVNPFGGNTSTGAVSLEADAYAQKTSRSNGLLELDMVTSGQHSMIARLPLGFQPTAATPLSVAAAPSSAQGVAAFTVTVNGRQVPVTIDLNGSVPSVQVHAPAVIS